MSEYKLPLDKLTPALVAFQAAVKAPPKTRENPHLKNKYADLQDVIDTIREPLTVNGLAISHEVSGTTLITKLLHVSGQSLKTEMPLLMGKQDMQGLGSALTYARRYSVSALLGIASDDCDDANGAARGTPTNTNSAAIPKNDKPAEQRKNEPQNPPTPPAPQMATEAQRKKIDELRNACGWSTDDIKAEIALTYKVKSSRELTLQQAKQMIDRLEAALAEKRKETP